MALALGRIGEPAASPALVAALSAKEAPLRAAALEALRELRGPLDPRRSPPLLADADETVRMEAVYTMGASRGRTLDARSRDQVTTALIDRLGLRSQRQHPPQGRLGAGGDRRLVVAGRRGPARSRQRAIGICRYARWPRPPSAG